MMESVFEMAEAVTSTDGAYPGWKPNPDSPILKVMEKTHQNLFGAKPHVKIIHAGLECGIIGNVYPNLDMISFGPTIRNAHSPDEKVHIESVKRFWHYLTEVLKSI
jgi:dipeptidase D